MGINSGRRSCTAGMQWQNGLVRVRGGGGGRRLRRGKREILAIWAEWEDEGEGRRRGLGRGKREIIAVEYKMVWMRV